MMGVYIKGMEMPKNCWDCLFSKFEDEECGNFVDGLGCSYRYKDWYSCILIENSKYTEHEALKGRCLDCPLVEVPPHGRLIDADALRENIKESRKRQPEISDVYTDDYFIVADWLRSAPTIISAEEGGT